MGQDLSTGALGWGTAMQKLRPTWLSPHPSPRRAVAGSTGKRSEMGSALQRGWTGFWGEGRSITSTGVPIECQQSRSPPVLP